MSMNIMIPYTYCSSFTLATRCTSERTNTASVWRWS